MRVIFATGGTGGHLYPAVALCQYLQEHHENVEVMFVGTLNRLESQVIPQMGYPYKGVDVMGLSGNPLRKLKALFKFVLSLSKTRKICKEFKPDIVIGFGGYVSASVVLSASMLKIKTMIHEQNSIIGLTNKILIKHVDSIVCCYDKAYEQFPKDKTQLLGNPRATAVVNAVKNENIKEQYHIDDAKKTVLIVMGSLGSGTVNEVIKEAIGSFGDKDYNIIFATGKNGYDKMKDLHVPENVQLVPYIDDMPSLLQEVDLVVTRAGATTLAELCALGKAMIIIPSPYVAANHQEFNAMELVDKGAAKMIKEKDLTKQAIVDMIDETLADDQVIESLEKNAKICGKADACPKMDALICKLIGE